MANPPQWTPSTYESGDFTQATPVGHPIFSAPIPLTTSKYVFTQEWQGPVDYPAVPLNTPHPSAGMVPDYSSYILVGEGDRRQVGPGQVRWIRTYAQVPASYSLFEEYPYPFVGYLLEITSGSPPITTNLTRAQTSWPESIRVQYDYFLTPNPGGQAIATVDPILGGPAVNISSAGDIPRIQETIYCFQNTLKPAGFSTGYLVGGLLFTTTILNPAASSLPTWPTSEQYQAMVADALANKWKSKVTIVKPFIDNNIVDGGHIVGAIDTANSVQGGQLITEVAKPTLWKGNIWVRSTRFVLAR